LRYFGDAIENFLKLQIRQHSVNTTESPQSSINQEFSKILLSKTPNIENIDSFFDFFPDACLIMMVSGGRALVESGVRSFDWSYEDSMWRWRNRAQTIFSFKEKHERLNTEYLLVRYEDLVANEKETLGSTLTI
jgi:hypothetical protein